MRLALAREMCLNTSLKRLSMLCRPHTHQCQKYVGKIVLASPLESKPDPQEVLSEQDRNLQSYGTVI